MRKRRVQVAIGSAVVAVAAIAVFIASGSRSVEIPEQGPWLIGVAADPRSFEKCLDDEAIVVMTQTASAPSTASTLKMVSDASLDDVHRVVSCVTESVAADRVSVETVS